MGGEERRAGPCPARRGEATIGSPAAATAAGCAFIARSSLAGPALSSLALRLRPCARPRAFVACAPAAAVAAAACSRAQMRSKARTQAQTDNARTHARTHARTPECTHARRDIHRAPAQTSHACAHSLVMTRAHIHVYRPTRIWNYMYNYFRTFMHARLPAAVTAGRARGVPRCRGPSS